jgi:hypothetical protein
MAYDDDIEESVVQFRAAAQAQEKPEKQEAKSTLKESLDEMDEDDDDLMMDAETIFIEK